MPNLHGLLSGLPHALYLEGFAGLAVLVAAWAPLRQAPFPAGLALTLLGGLLLSFHSYLMDAAILLPATLIVLAGTTRRWLKISWCPIRRGLTSLRRGWRFSSSLRFGTCNRPPGSLGVFQNRTAPYRTPPTRRCP
jgi:hypothetical protein